MKGLSLVISVLVFFLSLTFAEAALPLTTAINSKDQKWQAKRIVYQPGDHAPMHEHKTTRIVVVLNGGLMQVTRSDGKQMSVELKAGEISFRDAEVHALKNIGRTTIEVVEMELNPAP